MPGGGAYRPHRLAEATALPSLSEPKGAHPMKTEELKALGLNDEQVQKVFAMNGADIERKNQTITTLTTERDGIIDKLLKSGYDYGIKRS